MKMPILRFTIVFTVLCVYACSDHDDSLSLLQRTAEVTRHEVASQQLIPEIEMQRLLSEQRLFEEQIDAMDLQRALRILSVGPYQTLASRKHKLFFCTILKNAATEFMSLMMRVEGFGEFHWNPGRHHEPEDAVHNDPFRDVLLFNRTDLLSISELKGIYSGSSPGWTRGVVLRDPVERLVSAWMSKVKINPDPVRMEQRPLQPPVIPYYTSFEDMIQLLEDFGDLTNADPHLKLQSQQCGLAEQGSLEQFDVIGNMSSIAVDSMELLTSVGGSKFADEMLNTGWGTTGAMPLFNISRSKREAGNSDAMESGGTQAFIKKLSPDLIARIRKLYAADFELIEKANLIRAKRRAAA